MTHVSPNWSSSRIGPRDTAAVLSAPRPKRSPRKSGVFVIGGFGVSSVGMIGAGRVLAQQAQQHIDITTTSIGMSAFVAAIVAVAGFVAAGCVLWLKQANRIERLEERDADREKEIKKLKRLVGDHQPDPDEET